MVNAGVIMMVVVLIIKNGANDYASNEAPN